MLNIVLYGRYLMLFMLILFTSCSNEEYNMMNHIEQYRYENQFLKQYHKVGYDYDHQKLNDATMYNNVKIWTPLILQTPLYVIIALFVTILCMHILWLNKKRRKDRTDMKNMQINANASNEGVFESLKSTVIILTGSVDNLEKNINNVGTIENLEELEIIETQTQNIINTIEEVRVGTQLNDNANELIVLVNKLLSRCKGLINNIVEMLVDKDSEHYGTVGDEDIAFIQNISEIINEELLNSDLSPQLIADKVFFSIPYLNRKIKAITGLSTTAYILNIRFNKARKLLLTTQKQIGEVASECGFNDLAYFSRTFKREFGVTPSQFQRIGIE